MPVHTHAFQPILSMPSGQVVAYEALLRGPGGEPPGHVLDQVAPEDLAAFDGTAAESALVLAASLGLSCRLHLNFMPRTLQTCGQVLDRVLETAHRLGLRKEQLVVEVMERGAVEDLEAFTSFMNACKAQGVSTSIDDFGAGTSGLNLLADFQPDLVKLDMTLITRIQENGPRQAIVRAVSQVCVDLGIDLLAEGVETPGEYNWLASEGVELYQGFLFARPGFRSLPQVSLVDWQTIHAPGLAR